VKNRKLNIGKNSFSREIEVLGALFMLILILGFSIFFGLYSQNLDLDPRKEAAGNTIFVNNGDSLQSAIDSARSNDAIFLRPGSYTPSSANGINITNKNIRILGSGPEATTVTGAGASNTVFNIVNSSVTFESLRIAGAKEDGIRIDNSSNSRVGIIRSVVSGNAGSGVTNGGRLEVNTSIFEENGDGIVIGGTANIVNSVVRNSAKNGINIANESGENTNIQNVILENNFGTAINISAKSRVNVKNITAVNNGNGIAETGSNAITTISNSIVQSSKKDGIVLSNPNSTISYTNSSQNAGSNFEPSNLANASGNLSVNSNFISAREFRLSSNSKVVNQGNPAELDADGTRIDMGAFGGNASLPSGVNSLPRITSTPPQFIKPGQNYDYTIEAKDPDGDSLTFVVLNNNLPRWLIQENNRFSGTPTKSDIGYFGVMVVVSDRKGGNVVHPISINVLPEGREIPSSAPAPTQAPVQNITPRITLLSPTKDTVFDQENNEIRWSLNEGANVNNFTIKYSSDGTNFTTIATLPGSSRSYNWTDSSEVTSGRYFIRIEASDDSTPPVTVGVTSEQFEINNSPETTAPGSISITKKNPEDNDIVFSKKPLISVEFKPEGAELNRKESFLKINGQEVEYQITRNTIFYQPTSAFDEARVSLEVKLVTVNGGEDSVQWGFNIAGTTTPQDTSPTVTNNSKIFGIDRNIGLGILGFLFLILMILIIYFIVRFIKTIRDQRQGNLEAEFTEYYENPAYPEPQQTNYVNKSQNNQDLNSYYQNNDSQLEQNLPNSSYNNFTQNGYIIDQTDNSQQVSYQQVQTNADYQESNPQNQDYSQTVETQNNNNNNNAQTIQSLKEKYGVTDDQIQEYNQQLNNQNIPSQNEKNY
jgi:hypothetical protein